MTAPETDRIRALNDAFRQTLQGGHVMMTAGIKALPADVIVRAVAMTRGFTAFTRNNDPHEEHDFGNFEIVGQKFFWKIDYYDAAMEHGSEDSADPRKTTRVLTLMLAEEY